MMEVVLRQVGRRGAAPFVDEKIETGRLIELQVIINGERYSISELAGALSVRTPEGAQMALLPRGGNAVLIKTSDTSAGEGA